MKILYTLVILVALSFFATAQVCTVVITHVISGNQVQYYATSPDNPSQWSWFFNGGTPLTSSMQNPVVTYNTPGTYICACSISGGPNNCSASLSNSTDSVTITSSGIPEIKRINDVQVFNRNSVPTFEISCNARQNISVELYDVTGKLVDVVFKGYLDSGSNILQMRPVYLPAGNYVLNILSESGKITKKFNWEE
jgi:hypothetical protein